MLNRDWKKRLPMDLAMDILGGLIYAVGLNCFCSPNDIAPGGMSGVAVIVNYLFDFPMGIIIFCINIPLLVLAWLYLGHDFTLHSLKTILVWSVLVDLVAPYLPAYAGDKILAALFGGVSIGIGLFNGVLIEYLRAVHRLDHLAGGLALAEAGQSDVLSLLRVDLVKRGLKLSGFDLDDQLDGAVFFLLGTLDVHVVNSSVQAAQIQHAHN